MTVEISLAIFILETDPFLRKRVRQWSELKSKGKSPSRTKKCNIKLTGATWTPVRCRTKTIDDGFRVVGRIWSWSRGRDWSRGRGVGIPTRRIRIVTVVISSPRIPLTSWDNFVILADPALQHTTAIFVIVTPNMTLLARISVGAVTPPIVVNLIPTIRSVGGDAFLQERAHLGEA